MCFIYTTIGGPSSKFYEFLAERSQFDMDHSVDFIYAYILPISFARHKSTSPVAFDFRQDVPQRCALIKRIYFRHCGKKGVSVFHVTPLPRCTCLYVLFIGAVSRYNLSFKLQPDIMGFSHTYRGCECGPRTASI